MSTLYKRKSSHQEHGGREEHKEESGVFFV